MEPADYLARIDTGAGDRYDVSRLCHDAATFDAVVADLVALFEDSRVDLVAGIDALGFVLGTAVARSIGVGFVPVRKGRKLPLPDGARLERPLVDYSDAEKRLELDRTAVPGGVRVLVVDDWVETAAQLTAAVELVEAAGGAMAGIATVGAYADATAALRSAYPFHDVLPRR